VEEKVEKRRNNANVINAYENKIEMTKKNSNVFFKTSHKLPPTFTLILTGRKVENKRNNAEK